MTDYIRRAEALEITTRTCGDYAAAFAEIRKLPAADVAPVVHCRDCKYRRKNDENEPYFTAKDGLSDPWDDEFCSHGKRKEQTHGES